MLAERGLGDWGVGRPLRENELGLSEGPRVAQQLDHFQSLAAVAAHSVAWTMTWCELYVVAGRIWRAGLSFFGLALAQV